MPNVHTLRMLDRIKVILQRHQRAAGGDFLRAEIELIEEYLEAEERGTTKEKTLQEAIKKVTLQEAFRIVEEYEQDPYEIVEGTWIGAGKQLFYRDKRDGALYVDSSGNQQLTPNDVLNLKDLHTLKVER